MQIKSKAVLLLLISAFLCLPLQCFAATSPEVEALVHDNSLFACALYSKFSTRKGNLFFSPLAYQQPLP